MELHENIKALRTSRGWSQQHLADLAGYGDRSSIAKIESGKVDLPRSKIAEFARIFDVTPAYLMGYSDDTLALLDAIVDDNKTGRPAAIDELRRLFGTEHSIHNIYACKDSKRIALLYYKALERNVALSLTDIIGTVDQFDGSQAEKTMLLLHAYLKAEQPIRNIVDTALDPYVEDLDELPCSNSQIAPIKSDTKPAPVKQTVLPFPKAKINHRILTVEKEKAADDLTLAVDKFYNQTQTALDNVTALQTTVEMSREIVRARHKSFQEDMATPTEVIDAELLLSKVRVAILMAYYQFDTGLINLLAVCGMPESFDQYSRNGKDETSLTDRRTDAVNGTINN